MALVWHAMMYSTVCGVRWLWVFFDPSSEAAAEVSRRTVLASAHVDRPPRPRVPTRAQSARSGARSPADASTSRKMLSIDSIGDIATPALVAFGFGSGLLPSLASANRAALSSLFETPDELSEPTKAMLAGSAPLRSSPLLAYPCPLVIDDVLDVVGRFSAADATDATSSDISLSLIHI